MQGPIIEQLDKEIGDKVKITKMDVDANQKHQWHLELCLFQP